MPHGSLVKKGVAVEVENVFVEKTAGILAVIMPFRQHSFG
jgi:hypothetical protein